MKETIKTLIPESVIKQRVAQIGADITHEFRGEPVTIVGILRGAAMFTADLVRCIELDEVYLDFLALSSYGNSTTSSGEVRVEKDMSETVEGKNIIIVEDIVDSGRTMDYIIKYLKGRGAKCVKLCVLFDKLERREFDITADWIGFDVPDKFIVGYGLDYAQRYRNLPFIGEVVQEEE
jgi:hypoxanthine phosphoribosyltransferase